MDLANNKVIGNNYLIKDSGPGCDWVWGWLHHHAITEESIFKQYVFEVNQLFTSAKLNIIQKFINVFTLLHNICLTSHDYLL